MTTQADTPPTPWTVAPKVTAPEFDNRMVCATSAPILPPLLTSICDQRAKNSVFGAAELLLRVIVVRLLLLNKSAPVTVAQSGEHVAALLNVINRKPVFWEFDWSVELLENVAPLPSTIITGLVVPRLLATTNRAELETLNDPVTQALPLTVTWQLLLTFTFPTIL